MTSEIDFVCMAHCPPSVGFAIAGLRLDGRGWIRLGREHPTGVPPDAVPHLEGDGQPRAGDLLRAVVLGDVPPSGGHTEDRALAGPGALSRVEARGAAPIEIIEDAVAGIGLLFGDERARISVTDWAARGDGPSLMLVEPYGLAFEVVKLPRPGGVGRRCMANFRLAARPYSLPLLDREHRDRLCSLGIEMHFLGDIGLGEGHRTLLVVGLAPPAEGWVYKFVAGIVDLDQLRREAGLAPPSPDPSDYDPDDGDEGCSATAEDGTDAGETRDASRSKDWPRADSAWAQDELMTLMCLHRLGYSTASIARVLRRPPDEVKAVLRGIGSSGR